MLDEKPVTPEQRDVQDVFIEVSQKVGGFDRAADIVDAFFKVMPTSQQETMQVK
jgi:hypothetical protein